MILGRRPPISIDRVRIFYGGTLAAGLSLTVDLLFFGQRKQLTLKASGSINSFSDLLNIFAENVVVLVEMLDDFLNVVSLTFLDITIGHAPVSWSAEFGDRDIARTGYGATIGGSLNLANSAWGRLGFFGGGFGVDMDNGVRARGSFMGSDYEMFSASLAFKLDATFRNPLAADMADGITTAFSSTLGLLVDLNGNTVGQTINKQAMADVKLYRDAACDLKEVRQEV